MRCERRTVFSFSADEVLAAITPRTRLIIVNTPGNPTGGVVPEIEMSKLVRGLAETSGSRRVV